MFCVSVPVVNANDLSNLSMMGGVKEALWIEVPHENHRKEPENKLLGHHTCPQTDNSDYAEVDTQNMSSFYNARKETLMANPTPYATTILVNTMVPNNRSDNCSVSINF